MKNNFVLMSSMDLRLSSAAPRTALAFTKLASPTLSGFLLDWYLVTILDKCLVQSAISAPSLKLNQDEVIGRVS